MTAHAAHPWALVLAAGSGSRLADAVGGTRKQDLALAGAPLWWASARTLARLPRLEGLLFVFPPGQGEARGRTVAGLDANQSLGLPWAVVEGGERRQDSVRLGLAALDQAGGQDCDAVLIHDAARPFATASLAARVLDGLDRGEVAVIPGVPVKDTIKRVDSDGLVADTPDRSGLVAVQTPQGFRRSLLEAAHAQAEAQGWQVTDDAQIMERAGHRVGVVDGQEDNVKITTPGDLALLASGRAEMAPRTGWGYDVHRYAALDADSGRPLVIGGVPIPGGPRVEAHSDGDVLLHALTDAILGLVGAGDIGTHFPDTDPRYENLESAVFVKEAAELAARAGVRITHVDLTVIAQTPKLAPHRQAVAKNVARLLELPLDRVNAKATTEEGLGFTGENKGIKAVACVTALGPLGPFAGDIAVET